MRREAAHCYAAHYKRKSYLPMRMISNADLWGSLSAADEAFEQPERRGRLLLLRHVPTTLDQPQGGVGQRASQPEAHLERHDAVVIAPQDQRRQLDRLIALRQLNDAVGHDLARAMDHGVLAGGGLEGGGIR